MIQYTSWFKNSDRGKSGASLYIWNLNHFDIDFYHMLIFHLSPPPLLSAKPRQRTLRGLLGSSDSLWISVRGFHAAEKLNNNCKKTDRLFPKCHVSLNESQRWLFLPVMATDNGVQNLSPGAHLHSNKPPTSCSPFCCFFYSFLFFFFFQTLETENKLHFSRDSDVIIWAFSTSRSLGEADVLFHTWLVARSCIETVLYCIPCEQ